MALISVLWILLLLSALAATAMYIARTNAILTHRALQIAQAEFAADAAIVDTISRLSDERVSRHPTVDGNASHWEFDGIDVAISVGNESGRIDVNTADRELILAFLESQGVTADTASSLVDELRAPQAADSMAHNRLLETTDELRRIPSWRAQNLDRWMNSLTVYTGLPGITVANATPMTLEALQWAQAHHMGKNRNSVAAASATSGPLAERSVLGEVLRIRAEVALLKDVAATSEWVGRLTGDRRKPMLTLRWDHVGQRAAAPKPPSD